MSKNFLPAIFFLVLVIGSIYLYRGKNSRVGMDNPETTVATQDSNVVTGSGKYLPYSSQGLESSKGTRRVLFFYASWCPTCVPANADFEKNITTLPSDVTVIRVNYNDSDTDADEKSLATKYEITYQHTYVQIDGDGKEITKWNGGSTKELITRIK